MCRCRVFNWFDPISIFPFFLRTRSSACRVALSVSLPLPPSLPLSVFESGYVTSQDFSAVQAAGERDRDRRRCRLFQRIYSDVRLQLS